MSGKCRNKVCTLTRKTWWRCGCRGITAEYVRGLRASGLNPDQNQIIALKIQGADGEYYRGLKEAGIQPDVETLIATEGAGRNSGIRA